MAPSAPGWGQGGGGSQVGFDDPGGIFQASDPGILYREGVFILHCLALLKPATASVFISLINFDFIGQVSFVWTQMKNSSF